ncbi:MAG: ABC transporter permease [Treponema sp.]|nr:ABC transporter permease [Treponema sp.]
MNKFKEKLKLFSLSVTAIPIISVIVLILLIFIFSDTPVKTMYFFFLGPFRNIFNIGNLLNSMVPLIFGALGIIIAMKAGSLNLGGEGQIYFGAFITLITALSLVSFGVFGMIIAFLAGALASGSVAAISGICKAKWNTNELITTFLMSCAIIPIVNYLITGPFLDPQTSLVSTKKIAENMRLSFILKPSSLNTGFFISLVFVYGVNIFLNKTRPGYEFRMIGFNDMFARYGGINVKLNTIFSLALSGCLYGIAGSIAVLGTHHAVIKEFSAGLGWSGLTVALIANFSPVGVIPCAFFLAWINTGARLAMQNTGLTYEIVYIVQAVIFLLATSLFIRNLMNKKRKI